MSPPRFSVIIPVCNGEASLARAIESVLVQTYPAEEIVVVDDGSTDATPQVVEGYGARVRNLRQANRGVAAARNAGALAACGDWLTFLDADDWYFPDRLRLHADMLAVHADLDFLTGDYEYHDDTGALIGRSLERHPAGRRILARAAGAEAILMQDGDFEEFVADHFGDMHTLSVPRAAFLELGGFPEGFKVCEDVHFLVRLVSRSHRAGVVCRALGVYLIHDASATRRDPLQAQRENVRTLLDLKRLEHHFPHPVRRGFRRLLARARADLGYALTRAGQHRAAVRAVVPALWECPGTRTARVFASVLRG
jgi:glycosyltransferase involved in cell wall biosynthesis